MSEICFEIKYIKGLNCQSSHWMWSRGDGFLFTYWVLLRANLLKEQENHILQTERLCNRTLQCQARVPRAAYNEGMWERSVFFFSFWWLLFRLQCRSAKEAGKAKENWERWKQGSTWHGAYPRMVGTWLKEKVKEHSFIISCIFRGLATSKKNKLLDS